MKEYVVYTNGKDVIKTQINGLELFRRPLDDEDPDRPLKAIMPPSIFKDKMNTAYQRIRLVRRIIMYLVETLLLEMIDNANVFVFPRENWNFRLGIGNGAFTGVSYRPYFAFDNQKGALIQYGKRYGYGYRFEVVFGKHFYKRLKQKVLAGKRYRKRKEL